MFNYAKNDTIKMLKLKKIFDDRWRKDRSDADYKSDNDIFGIKLNKTILDGKHYKKLAIEKSESKIDKMLRSNSPYYKGIKNNDYLSSTFRSNIFSEENSPEKSILNNSGSLNHLRKSKSNTNIKINPYRVIIKKENNNVNRSSYYSVGKKSTRFTDVKEDSKVNISDLSLMNGKPYLKLHENNEKLIKNAINIKLKKREDLTSIVSKSIIESKKGTTEKKKLQEINQKQQFFFHKDKRDHRVEKVKELVEKRSKEQSKINAVGSSRQTVRTFNVYKKMYFSQQN